jgi:hypothetical protein
MQRQMQTARIRSTVSNSDIGILRSLMMGKRGGARPGAGRKPSTLKGVLKQLPKDQAAGILAEVDADGKWKKLLNSRDERVRLETLKYLTDRAHGKARQDGRVAVGTVDFTAEYIGGDTGQKSTAEIDEQIRQLERQLGLHTQEDLQKAREEAKEQVRREMVEQVQPQPPHLPAAPVAPSKQCEKHGPYDSEHQKPCPECAREWAEASQKEQQHWRSVMPGEPMWSRWRV